MNHPNVLLLTVDALRADRISFQGYERGTTPVLGAMAKNSVWCDNAFSLAAHTQASFPSIFTSTRPLSFGGYDRGVLDRPNTLTEMLQGAGYETTHLLTFPWLRDRYGYDRGSERTEHFYNIANIVGSTLATFRSEVEAHLSGAQSFEALVDKSGPVIRGCFEDLIAYCGTRQAQADLEQRYFPNSFFVQAGYDWPRVQAVISQHLSEFDRSASDYVRRHILGLPREAAHLWVTADFKMKRRPGALAGFARDLVNVWIIRLIHGRASEKEALVRMRHKRFADSAELADRVISILEEPRERPLFLWTHFLDGHVPYCAGRLPGWQSHTGSYLKQLGYADDVDPAIATIPRPRSEEEFRLWRQFYDAGVYYMDEQFGRILQALDDTGQRENTLIVVAGDHGEEIGEHGDISHHFRFYDHTVHVPLVFHHPDLEEKRIDDLVDLRDLAPTSLEMAGVSLPSTYEGKPLGGVAGQQRSHILFETFHRGNCLFRDRPVYMGVRTQTHKYIWREWIDPVDNLSKDRVELYNLTEDPEEMHNLYNPDDPIVRDFDAIIAERLSKIPSFVSNRSTSDLAALGIESPGVGD